VYLFPAIDLRNGQVVRLAEGDYNRQTIYPLDPVAQAQNFAHDGASWLHLVDLDGARSGQMAHLDIIKNICTQTNLKVEVGGGVRSQKIIDQLLQAGVERVILGTAALQNWPWFEKLLQHPDYQHRLVLGLDARNGKLAVSGWREQTQMSALDVAAAVTDQPLAAIVYTDIHTDGLMKGPNLHATQQIINATQIPIVASGGVGNLEHLRALQKLKIQGAIVGRAIYEHALTVKQAVALFEHEN